MNSIRALTLSAILASAAAFAPAADAANCSSIAASEAASRNAEVLSVHSEGGGGKTVCVIRLRVPGKGGQPPRVQTIRKSG